MEELSKIVSRYVSGEISYQEFRSLFLPLLVMSQHGDSAKRDASDRIESKCADFSEGYLHEDALKSKLGGILYPVGASFVSSIEVDLPLMEDIQISFVGSGNVGDPILNPVGNRSEESELALNYSP